MLPHRPIMSMRLFSVVFICVLQVPSSKSQKTACYTNSECKFPFIYKGVTYNQCTESNHGNAWCATKTDDENNYIKGKWTTCEEKCPECVTGPSAPGNAKVSCTVGSCRIKCKRGYLFPTGESTVYYSCENGDWKLNTDHPENYDQCYQPTTSVPTPVFTTITTISMIEMTKQITVFPTSVSDYTNSSTTFSTIDLTSEAKLSKHVPASSTTIEPDIGTSSAIHLVMCGGPCGIERGRCHSGFTCPEGEKPIPSAICRSKCICCVRDQFTESTASVTTPLPTFSTIYLTTESKLSTSGPDSSTTVDPGIESTTSDAISVFTTGVKTVTTTPMPKTTNQITDFSTSVSDSTNSLTTFSTIDLTTESKLSTSGPDSFTTIDPECGSCSSKVPFPELYPNFTWPEAVPGIISMHNCPEGLGDKKATWFCQNDCTWDELPDLSQCGTVDSDIWKDEMMNGNQSAGDTLERLTTTLDQIAPGDLISVLDILSVSWERHQKDLASLTNQEEQLILSSNYTESALQVTDAILDKPQVWSGLPRNQRYNESSQLQVSLEQAAVGAASFLQENSEKNFSTKTTDVHIEKFPRTKHRLNNIFTHPKFNSTYIKLPSMLDEDILSANIITFMAFSNLHDILGSCSLGLENITFPNIVVASPVIGLTLGNTSWHSNDGGLNNYVQATFAQLYSLQGYNVSDLRCVSWNTELNSWDTKGCWLVKGDSPNTTTCHCNHLTNLAVIMDVNGVLNSTTKAYLFMEYVTEIGCSLSIICLAATIFCLLIFADIRSKMISKIRINVCFCLMTAEIIMLAGLDKVDDVTGCIIIAALLHYFFLSTFLWAAIEGFYLYLKLIRVFPSMEPKLRTYLLVGYTIPLLFVLITLASTLPVKDGTSYLAENACWLGPGVIWSFAAPLGLIMLINVVIFILCMRAQWRTNSSEVQQKTNFLVKLRGSACIFFILGITWITGFLYLEYPILAIPFTILNSLQGVIIFLLLIPSDRIIRTRFKVLCSKWSGEEHQQLNVINQGTGTSRTTQSEMLSRRRSSLVHNRYL